MRSEDSDFQYCIYFPFNAGVSISTLMELIQLKNMQFLKVTVTGSKRFRNRPISMLNFIIFTKFCKLTLIGNRYYDGTGQTLKLVVKVKNIFL